MRFVVHGFVQGVGYRSYVRRIAGHLGVRGYVKNQQDGSVLVIAEADENVLKAFEKEINVSIIHGIQVLNIERNKENASTPPFAGFKIEK